MSGVARYLAPTALADALAALADPRGATVLAGGTDLMPQTQAHRVAFKPTLLNLRHITALRSVTLTADHLVLGALTTVTDLLTDQVVARHAPLLVEAAQHFASPQIRNAATLGGNLCNASPAGDLLPPLLALDAEIGMSALDAEGAVIERWLAVADFFSGPGRTQRGVSELVTAVRVPLSAPALLTRFFKSGTRPALDISTIAIALAAQRDAQGRLHGVRLALGAVAPTPVRARGAETLLEGQVLDDALALQAAQCAADEITPIDDVRASAWYRRELVRNMTQRMLSDVVHA